MNDEKCKGYIVDVISLLKGLAIKAKKNQDNSKEGFEDYNKGLVMGYYLIITLLKNQAFAFCIDQKELGLADIKPDIDLLGLPRNLDIDFGEDNWEVDVITEEKVKGYLIDLISLLKDQAREAKLDVDNLEKDSHEYNRGLLMAYYEVIATMKNQASSFGLEQKDLGLADIELGRDLL